MIFVSYWPSLIFKGQLSFSFKLNEDLYYSEEEFGLNVRSLNYLNLGSVLPQVNFDVKRKPTFIVISVLLPTLFLSVLNLLVFVIPVDSGEKISYGR